MKPARNLKTLLQLYQRSLFSMNFSMKVLFIELRSSIVLSVLSSPTCQQCYARAFLRAISGNSIEIISMDACIFFICFFHFRNSFLSEMSHLISRVVVSHILSKVQGEVFLFDLHEVKDVFHLSYLTKIDKYQKLTNIRYIKLCTLKIVMYKVTISICQVTV